jgi:hypothetical protein
MSTFHHVRKASSISPPAGGLSIAIVAVARQRKEYHVVAAVEGHELKTPETEHRPGLERLLETAGPYLARQLSAFRPRGVPGPTSKLSPRVPAQMDRREAGREGGRAAGGRQAWEVEPAAFVLASRPGRVRLQ